MNGQPSVLIVDRSAETREVLQTALERRGVKTLAAGGSTSGLKLAREHQPDLIVLDLEIENPAADQFSAPSFGTNPPVDADASPAINGIINTPSLQNTSYQPRLVLLGNLRRWRERLPNGEFVAKPYHYGPLIRKIEELLAGNGQNAAK